MKCKTCGGEIEFGQLYTVREEVGYEHLIADNCIDALTTRVAAAEGLLTTACDAWECGHMVWNQEGVLLSDYKAAMLPRAWYEAAKGGRE